MKVSRVLPCRPHNGPTEKGSIGLLEGKPSVTTQTSPAQRMRVKTAFMKVSRVRDEPTFSVCDKRTPLGIIVIIIMASIFRRALVALRSIDLYYVEARQSEALFLFLFLSRDRSLVKALSLIGLSLIGLS